MFPHTNNVIPIHPDLAGIRTYERHDQLEGDAFPSAATAKNAKRLPLFKTESDAVQDALRAERFRHMFELNRDGAGLVHSAVSGKRKYMHLISKTSATMINSEDTTTLLVAASPTPLAPLSVV